MRHKPEIVFILGRAVQRCQVCGATRRLNRRTKKPISVWGKEGANFPLRDCSGPASVAGVPDFIGDGPDKEVTNSAAIPAAVTDNDVVRAIQYLDAAEVLSKDFRPRTGADEGDEE